MLLIQTSKWFGPSRHAQENDPKDRQQKSTVELETLATRLPLPEALARLKFYQEEFARAFGRVTAVEYSLLGVQDLGMDLTDDDLENANIHLIEAMGESLADEPTWWEQSR